MSGQMTLLVFKLKLQGLSSYRDILAALLVLLLHGVLLSTMSILGENTSIFLSLYLSLVVLLLSVLMFVFPDLQYEDLNLFLKYASLKK